MFIFTNYYCGYSTCVKFYFLIQEDTYDKSCLSNLIELGDEVFIWRSDGGNKGSGGIVARTQVIGTPQEYTDEEKS